MQFSQKLLAFAACASTSLATAADAADADTPCRRPTVTLASGIVIGTNTALDSPTGRIANKFIGIPYAESPPERFSPPKPAPSWSKPLQAVETKPACVQQFQYPDDQRRKTRKIYNNPGGPPPPESEDCLYINVYTPPHTQASDSKPVMFWIYGGNLQFGDSGLPLYDGSSFAANQDVVFVAFNYRTNVFGYPNSPEIKSRNQNAGFLDQRLALQWTRDNIAKFGGSPDKITIFGESAGGESVKQLIALPPSPLPFRGGIMESYGSAFTGSGAESWKTLVASLGCNKASSATACVRGKSVKAIKSIIEEQELDFPPVDNNITSISDFRSAIDAGTAAKVPFMMGSNKDEGRAFAYIGGLNEPGASIVDFINATFPDQKRLQKTLRAEFKASGKTTYLFASEIITNMTFLCTTSMVSQYATDHDYSVWRYFYNASFPNIHYFPRDGVYHISEVPEVFGTYPREGAKQQQIKLSRYMQKAWAQFAKDPENGPGWPTLGPDGYVGNLGGDGIYGQKMARAAYLDLPCPLYNPLIDAGGL